MIEDQMHKKNITMSDEDEVFHAYEGNSSHDSCLYKLKMIQEVRNLTLPNPKT